MRRGPRRDQFIPTSVPLHEHRGVTLAVNGAAPVRSPSGASVDVRALELTWTRRVGPRVPGDEHDGRLWSFLSAHLTGLWFDVGGVPTGQQVAPLVLRGPGVGGLPDWVRNLIELHRPVDDGPAGATVQVAAGLIMAADEMPRQVVDNGAPRAWLRRRAEQLLREARR